MIPKSTLMLEEMFESKFWTFTGAYPMVDKWNAWLGGNGISKKTWIETGLSYFKNQKSEMVYIKNPSARLFGSEPKLLGLQKEIAIKILMLGCLP